MLIICIFFIRPATIFWAENILVNNILTLYLGLFTIIYESLILLAVVLLGTNRKRSLVSAAFVLVLINCMNFPVEFFIGTIIQPSMSMMNFIEETHHTPVFYLFFFIYEFLLLCCCFLAARWLRKTQGEPPRNYVIYFSLFFIIFALIVYIWGGDIYMIISASFLANALLSTLLVAVIIMTFYVYTRLLSKKKIITPNKIDTDYTSFIPQLSRREIEVIEAVLSGYVSQKELAASLNISVNTVKTHLKHIYQTTGVSSVDALSLLFQGYVSNHPEIIPKSP
jgi:DNA-binding CsgD family transcriptional regulator